MTNYYILKLYGIPFTTIDTNKYAETLHPFIITEEPDQGISKNFKIMDEKSTGPSNPKTNLSDYIPLLMPATEAGYSEPVTNYASNPKIDEKHIPYIHAGLINSGKIDETTVIDFATDNEIQGSTINTDKMIHGSQLKNMNDTEVSKKQPDFETAFINLCKCDNSIDNEAIRLYAYDTVNGPEEYLAYFRKNSSSEILSDIIFTRTSPLQIYYAKASDLTNGDPSTLYKLRPNTMLPHLYELTGESVSYDSSLDEQLFGHKVKLRQPFPYNTADKDIIFYPWSNSVETVYLTTSTAETASQVYTFNTSLMRYMPVDVDSQNTYVQNDAKSFQYNGNYFFFSGSILENDLISPSPNTANIIGSTLGIRLDGGDNSSYLKLCDQLGNTQMNELKLLRNIEALNTNQQGG